MTDYKQRELINKSKWTSHFGAISDDSGIYVLMRREGDFKYAYVGQAKHILTRLAQHLDGYQHIDLSLKKHGLLSVDNLEGWGLWTVPVPESELDDWERHYMKYCADRGFQLRNKTSGGQNKGKYGIAPNKPSKGYYDGLRQGEANMRKQVAVFFEKYLDAVIKQPSNKIKERKLNEFLQLIKNDNLMG